MRLPYVCCIAVLIVYTIAHQILVSFVIFSSPFRPHSRTRYLAFTAVVYDGHIALYTPTVSS